MRRKWIILALLALPALEGTALAEKSPSREAVSVNGTETRSGARGADDTPKNSLGTEANRSHSDAEVMRSQRKKDLPSRVVPILLISVGGATAVYSGLWMLLGSICDTENCTTNDLTGFAVAGAVGLTALTVGIVWLVDVNNRRHAIERGARTTTGRRSLLPLYDPHTQTAALVFSQQF
jgi:hypothetical protein